MTNAATLAEALAARFGETFECQLDEQEAAQLCTIASHRSHRRFEAEAIDERLMQTLFACAFSAPSKSDLQQASVVRVRDRSQRAAIERLIPAMPWVASAPELLVFCGDNSRIHKISDMRAHPFANDHLDSFFNASVDAALVLMNFMRAAEAVRLGCCPLSMIRNHASEVAQILDLPKLVFPLAGLAVGYPATAGAISARLPLRATVHTDRYDDSSFADDIDAYDRRRHERQPIAPEKQREVDRFGRQPFYPWSEDKARQVAVRERAEFGAFIRDQGFCLD